MIQECVLVGNQLLGCFGPNKARKTPLFLPPVFLKCYSFFFLLPNTRITTLEQSHNNWVAVMLRHSQYAYALVFVLLFFLSYKRLHEGAHLSLKCCCCCSFLLYHCFKGSWSPSTHPTYTNPHLGCTDVKTQTQASFPKDWMWGNPEWFTSEKYCCPFGVLTVWDSWSLEFVLKQFLQLFLRFLFKKSLCFIMWSVIWLQSCF